jgi:hypothetical protein
MTRLMEAFVNWKLLLRGTVWALIIALGLSASGVVLAGEEPLANLLIGAVADDDEDDDEFEFSGAVQSLPAGGLVGDWVVDGRTVHVTASTELDLDGGSIAIGTRVEVEGQPRSDGSIDANEIERDDGGDDDDDDDDD